MSRKMAQEKDFIDTKHTTQELDELNKQYSTEYDNLIALVAENFKYNELISANNKKIMAVRDKLQALDKKIEKTKLL
jgi:hypothetical protein